MSDYLLGIDLGGSSIKAQALNPTGQSIRTEKVSFDTAQPLDWAQKIRQVALDLQRHCGGPAAAFGLAAPGLASPDQRHITCMPGRLQGLEGLDWTDFLQSAHPVPVLNDAHAALCGEAWVGAAAGARNVVMLTLGTGVGGAVMVDGHLLRGHLGRAGHLGHICLDLEGALDIVNTPGSLELMIGNCTIRERTDGRFASTHELLRSHQGGDAEATRIWLKSVKALAAALVSFINILDPEVIIIGGGIAAAGPLLFEPLHGFLNEFEWRPRGHRVQIRAAQLGEFAGATGAAFTALQTRAAT